MAFVDQRSFPTYQAIILDIESVTDRSGKLIETEEAYHLVVDAVTSVVTIKGSSVTGVLHGVQTLISLAHPDNTVQEVDIIDYPRYKYRGENIYFHLCSCSLELHIQRTGSEYY